MKEIQYDLKATKDQNDSTIPVHLSLHAVSYEAVSYRRMIGEDHFFFRELKKTGKDVYFRVLHSHTWDEETLKPKPK